MRKNVFGCFGDYRACVFCLALALSQAAVMPVSLSAASIQYRFDQVLKTQASLSVYRYSFVLSDFSFQTNQELDIQFDPRLFSALSNGSAGSGFDLLLLQPNNPPQASGEYSALAVVDNPSLLGTFGVDAVYTGTGTPANQVFSINQFSSSGQFEKVITSGVVTPFAPSAVPEPGTLGLFCIALVSVSLALAVRRIHS